MFLQTAYALIAKCIASIWLYHCRYVKCSNLEHKRSLCVTFKYYEGYWTTFGHHLESKARCHFEHSYKQKEESDVKLMLNDNVAIIFTGFKNWKLNLHRT